MPIPAGAPDFNAQEAKEFAAYLASFMDRPLEWVQMCYPWQQEDTQLANETGPDKWQRDYLNEIGAQIRGKEPLIRMGASSGHGSGKAHPVDLIIDTPAGPRRFGDLRPGDEVFGSNGCPIKVTAIHPQGVMPVYRVTFDDHADTLATGLHLWTVNHRRGQEVLSTEEIIDRGVLRSNGVAKAKQFSIPEHGPFQYPWQSVLVDPYTMGAWLGDGCRKTGRITSGDPELFERIRSFGYEVRDNKKEITKTIRGIAPLLRRYGVWGCGAYEKFVPPVYKYNIPEIRLEVLRGLLDTDGYVSETGNLVFAVASKVLRDDVMWLVRSLGGKATPGGREGSWSCSFSFPDAVEPVTLARKRSRLRKQTQKRYLKRYIANIEPAGEVDCMCITVDAPDSLYIANDAIVTHNSALVSWLIHWFESTRHNAQLVVTANTATQLKTKTWRELAKWHNLAINGWMFEWSATSYKCVWAPETWYAAAIPWSEHNSEAFAGLHEKYVGMLFDESSGIADTIYEVAEGAMTTEGAMFHQFGNCTRNTGRFYQSMFGNQKHRWTRYVVDTRTAKKRNDALLKQWEEDWGEDSDYFRVRVRGLYPKHGALQFISSDVVGSAVQRNIPDEDIGAHFPLLMGVDVARQGDDESVIIMRKQRKMRKEVVRLTIRNTFNLAKVVNRYIILHRPDAVFVDGVGIGAGVVDTLVTKFGHDNIIEVQAGSKPNDDKLYLNTRIEMWDKMRQWLELADIPDDADLQTQLTTPEYGFERRSEKMKLESKEDMKKRGEASPDIADALAMTFAQTLPVKQGENFLIDSEEPEYA